MYISKYDTAYNYGYKIRHCFKECSKCAGAVDVLVISSKKLLLFNDNISSGIINLSEYYKLTPAIMCKALLDIER